MNDNFHQFIYDENQIKKFHSILSPLKPDEAYFVSMSARAKYLTKEERVRLNLGRAEMFHRKLVKRQDFETFMRVLKSMQVSYGGYTTKNNSIMPDHCLVVYANINPSSGRKALKEFYQKTTTSLFDIYDNPELLKNFASLDTELMNCYQRQTGTKTLIDIDFDIPEDKVSLLEYVLNNFIQNKLEYYVIQTKSGYHVLIKRDTISYNYTEVVNTVNKMLKETHPNSEIIVNKNGMVPCPGTLQAGFEVKFSEKYNNF